MDYFLLLKHPISRDHKLHQLNILKKFYYFLLEKLKEEKLPYECARRHLLNIHIHHLLISI